MPSFTGSYGKKGSSSSGKGKFTGSYKKSSKKRGDKWWNVPQKVADVVVDDAKTLATGLPKAALEGGIAAGTILSPYSSPGAKKKAATGMASDYLEGVKALGTTEAWTERPLTSTLTALGLAAPLAGGASVGRIAASIGAANRTMSRSKALTLARRESRNPGYLAAQGIEGGLKRTLKSEVPGGKTREVELPQARSGLGRGFQAAGDKASKALPKGAPLSERRRANRQLAREADETDRRSQAHAANLMQPVRKVAFGRMGTSRRGDQSLLAYALQTPKVTGDPFMGPKLVATRFDQILKDGGYTRDNLFHALTPSERKRLTNERNRIRKALADPPDPSDFAAAVAAMERTADESEAVAKYITQGRAKGVSPDEAARLDEIFEDRKNLLSTYLGIEGEARGFFPHRMRFELRDKGAGAGVRGAGTVIGRPQPSVNMKKNQLRLFESGKVDTDPRVLEKQYASNMRFLENEQRRRELFDEGVPLDMLTGKEKGGYLIRDPDRAAAKLSPEQRAMHDPMAQARQLLDEGDEDGAFASWRDQFIRRDTEAPEEWLSNPESVRWVPKDVVDKRLPRRIAVDPEAKVRPLLGTLNALARVATIQGKPARYLSTNTVQNIITATITNPTAAARGIVNQASYARGVRAVDKMWRTLRLPDGLHSRRPDLYRLIGAETGDVQATAGLPNIRSSANKTQKVERAATAAQHKLGEALGHLADSPYRNAVWLKHAHRLGFKTDAQLERLLTSKEPNIVRARRQAMQSTRDDMYDFNRLSSWERDTISRFFFLWPLVRAGVRYPITYTRDYPVRMGVGAALTMDDESAGDTEVRDLFKYPTSEGKELDTAWAMPQGITVQQLENLQRVLGGDFPAIGGMLSPPLRDAGQALFGFDRPADERAERFLRSILPGFAAGQDVYREGGRGVPVVKRFTPQPKSER